MKADLDVLRNLSIAKPIPDSKMYYVRLIDIPQPFRAEFKAWIGIAACPGSRENTGNGACRHGRSVFMFLLRKTRISDF